MSQISPNVYRIAYSFGDGDLKSADVSAWSLESAWSILKYRVSQKILFHSATCQGFYFDKLSQIQRFS